MTTIAWDGKTLAADSQTSCAGSVWANVTKIAKVGKMYVAATGSIAQISKLNAWLKGGCEGDGPDWENCEAIVIDGGRVMFYGDSSPVEMNPAQPLAIGSGWQFAIAAMDFGKTAKQAVEYAMTRDNGTGGGVDFVRIRTAKA